MLTIGELIGLKLIETDTNQKMTRDSSCHLEGFEHRTNLYMSRVEMELNFCQESGLGICMYTLDNWQVYYRYVMHLSL